MATVNLICLSALVAIVSGASIICTDYGKGLGGGGGYYGMPIPKSCTSDGWYPDYRIKKSGEYHYFRTGLTHVSIVWYCRGQFEVILGFIRRYFECLHVNSGSLWSQFGDTSPD